MKNFMIIASASRSTLGIGNNGKIPWKITQDMKLFKDITSTSCLNKKNVVIMGRKTWESLPNKSRPLPDRINIVISRDPLIRTKIGIPATVLVVDSLNLALMLSSNDTIDKVYVIGGGSVYQEAIELLSCSRIYLTEVLTEITGIDTFFPIIPHRFKMVALSDTYIENKVEYRFIEYANEFEHTKLSIDLLSTDVK